MATVDLAGDAGTRTRAGTVTVTGGEAAVSRPCSGCQWLAGVTVTVTVAAAAAQAAPDSVTSCRKFKPEQQFRGGARSRRRRLIMIDDSRAGKTVDTVKRDRRRAGWHRDCRPAPRRTSISLPQRFAASRPERHRHGSRRRPSESESGRRLRRPTPASPARTQFPPAARRRACRVAGQLG